LLIGQIFGSNTIALFLFIYFYYNIDIHHITNIIHTKFSAWLEFYAHNRAFVCNLLQENYICISFLVFYDGYYYMHGYCI